MTVFSLWNLNSCACSLLLPCTGADPKVTVSQQLREVMLPQIQNNNSRSLGIQLDIPYILCDVFVMGGGGGPTSTRIWFDTVCKVI